jgi:hypothetical protein
VDLDDVSSIFLAWVRHLQAAVAEVSLTLEPAIYCTGECRRTDYSGRHRDSALGSGTRRYHPGTGTARSDFGRSRPDEVELLAAHRLEHRDMFLWVRSKAAVLSCRGLLLKRGDSMTAASVFLAVPLRKQVVS